jgi:hypothetical protein
MNEVFAIARIAKIAVIAKIEAALGVQLLNYPILAIANLERSDYRLMLQITSLPASRNGLRKT